MVAMIGPCSMLPECLLIKQDWQERGGGAIASNTSVRQAMPFNWMQSAACSLARGTVVQQWPLQPAACRRHCILAAFVMFWQSM